MLQRYMFIIIYYYVYYVVTKPQYQLRTADRNGIQMTEALQCCSALHANETRDQQLSSKQHLFASSSFCQPVTENNN